MAGEIEILHCETGGDTALFLHGLGASAVGWSELVRRLPGRKVAWNAPGYGASSPLPGAASLPAYLSALGTVLRSLGPAPVHVVAHSWGTLLAAGLAKAMPQQVRSLALINPTPGYAASAPTQREAAKSARLATIEAWGAAAVVRRMASDLLARNATHHLVEVAGHLGIEVTSKGMRDAIQLLFSIDLLQLLADGPSLPILAVIGEQDRVTGPDIGTEISKRFPNARCVLLPTCGHLALLEQPDETARNLRSFWDRCRQESKYFSHNRRDR